MVDYTERILADGTVIKYRKNPPIDPTTGKPKPTSKQLKARKAASQRMRAAHTIIAASGLQATPGSQAYSEQLRNILSKNINSNGKKKSRITSRRSKVCRKNGKITSCSQLIK